LIELIHRCEFATHQEAHAVIFEMVSVMETILGNCTNKPFLVASHLVGKARRENKSCSAK
jgi:hypothetical protein